MIMNRVSVSFMNQHGASMLEILVALVVIALGLLGIAGMNIIGLKDSNLAYQYSVATLQAQDMAERIGANRVGISRYDAITWWTAGDVQPTSCVSVCTEVDGVISCSSPACTTAQMAADDSWRWNYNNRTMLPSGNGSVTEDDGDYLIAVRWSDPQLNGADGWDGTAGTDTRVSCGDPSSTANNNLRCHALRYRP